MKKCILLLIILLLLTSCQNAKEKIIGNWVTSDGGILILNSDGTYELHNVDLENGILESFNVSVTGNNAEFDNGTYEISGRQITFTSQSAENLVGDFNVEDNSLKIGAIHFTRENDVSDVEYTDNDYDTEFNDDDDLESSEDDYGTEFNNDNDLEFLKEHAIETDYMESENYSWISNSKNDYSNDPDEIEYYLFSAKEDNEEEIILFDDEKYKVFRLGSDIYVINKSLGTETPQQYLHLSSKDTNEHPFNTTTSFYKGDILYLCSDYEQGETYSCNNKEYPAYSSFCNVLAINENHLLFLENCVFSEDYSYLAHSTNKYAVDHNNGVYASDLYIIKTETFDLEFVEAANANNITVSNNGTVVYSCKQGISLTNSVGTNYVCVKYPNDPTIYILSKNNANIRPIYINNDKQYFFIFDIIGIKKISASGEETAFKYAGFSTNPHTYSGVKNGKKSNTVHLWDYQTGAEQILDLNQY